MSNGGKTSALLPRIRACIFDVDGLLINSEDIYTDIYNQILHSYDRPSLTWTTKALQQSRGTTTSYAAKCTRNLSLVTASCFLPTLLSLSTLPGLRTSHLRHQLAPDGTRAQSPSRDTSRPFHKQPTSPRRPQPPLAPLIRNPSHPPRNGLLNHETLLRDQNIPSAITDLPLYPPHLPVQRRRRHADEEGETGR
ncbi:MAG: hypothetical protein L6R40_008478 [Gallowayella cf. fulva]|nr:MAG: hypothetical protein L6R40_008478 [Xanthomendoza cf. fulva]